MGEILHWKSIIFPYIYGTKLHNLMLSESGYIKVIGSQRLTVRFDKAYVLDKLKHDFSDFQLPPNELANLINEALDV
ncbi:MAG: hypothetical protein N5P05_000494 [Chroococcopsis gigantea SAG 12.99]|jgi:hypothetical protein|nr:hypothetical protein [Chroococcopsis gigantea SAG 12.99]